MTSMMMSQGPPDSQAVESLMNELQILQNRAAKLILDRPLHFSDALTVLRWLNLEERRKCHRCIYAYKCINGQLDHSLDIARKNDMHSYKDFHESERTVRNSASLPIFVFKFIHFSILALYFIISCCINI